MEIVSIPLQSTIPTEQEKQDKLKSRANSGAPSDSHIGLHSVDDQVTMDGLPAEDRHAKEASLSTIKKAAGKPVSQSSSTEMFLLTKPQLPASLGKVDPIAESPKKVWYFRSRKLGEKGPLKGKAVQEFLDRGDLCIGCIVWREDWDDWIPAEKVFPKLAAEAKSKSNKQKPHRAFKDANYQNPDQLDPDSERLRIQRKRVLIFRGLIATGLVIICILIVILIQLLSQ